MIIECPTETIRGAVALAGKAISGRSPIPIAATVLLRAENGRLHVTGTNFDQTVTATTLAKVVEEGSCTLPYRLLESWLGSVNNAVRIEWQPGEPKATLTTGRITATQPVLNPEDYPAIPLVKDDWPRLTLPAPVAARAMQRAVAGVADDESRPILTGVNIACRDGQVAFAGADSFRLSVATVELGENEPVPECIVHGDAVRMALTASKGAETVAIAVDPAGKKAAFILPDAIIVASLIEGKFPNYQQLIPVDPAAVVTVEAAELNRVMRSAMVYARGDVSGEGQNKVHHGTIRLWADPSREGEITSLRVRARAAEIGQQDAEVDARIEATERAKIALHSGYLADGLALVDGDVRLNLWTPQTQCVIEQVGDPTFRYVCMPQFVTWED